MIHRLWLGQVSRGFAGAQFVVHQAGALGIVTGLLLLYGGIVAAPRVEPLLAIASITTLVGALMMIYMVLKAGAAPDASRQAGEKLI